MLFIDSHHQGRALTSLVKAIFRYSQKYALALILIAGLAAGGCGSDKEPGPKTAETPVPATTLAPVLPTAEIPAAEVPAPVSPTVETPAATTPEMDAEVSPIVARVNGVPILTRLLESQLIMSEAGRGVFEDKSVEDESAQKAADLALKLEVFNGLVGLELACQEALARGYRPTEAEFEEALSALQNNFDEPDQLYKSLDQYGQTIEELRQNLIKTLALQKWQENEFLARMMVTEEEARAFYDQHPEIARHPDMVRAGQIFLGVPLASLPETRKKVRARGEAALVRLQAGQDFQAVAREFSDGPEVELTGGDMGWLEKDSTLPFFSSTVFNLKPGETSRLLESPLGFHIFQVRETKAAGNSPFKELRAHLVDHLSTDKLTRAIARKMDELYLQADIEIYDPKLKQDYTEHLEAEKQSRDQ